MTFKDDYISGSFLSRLYDVLYDSRRWSIASRLDLPCDVDPDCLDYEIFRLLLILDELKESQS